MTTAELKQQLTKTKKPGGSTPASSLTRAALATLHLFGFTAWRQNNAGVYDKALNNGAGGYRAGSAKRGISDIMGYCERTGKIVAVEVKVGRDTLSDEQTEYLVGIDKAGGFAFECRDSVDALHRKCKAWRGQHPAK